LLLSLEKRQLLSLLYKRVKKKKNTMGTTMPTLVVIIKRRGVINVPTLE
jgi:hypothetical protein